MLGITRTQASGGLSVITELCVYALLQCMSAPVGWYGKAELLAFIRQNHAIVVIERRFGRHKAASEREVRVTTELCALWRRPVLRSNRVIMTN